MEKKVKTENPNKNALQNLKKISILYAEDDNNIFNSLS